jgi:hypothetical protein
MGMGHYRSIQEARRIAPSDLRKARLDRGTGDMEVAWT